MNTILDKIALLATGGVLYIPIILGVIINIIFAIAVLKDSYRMIRIYNRGTYLVGGGTWALATLVGGVVTAAIYWLIHHSTLRVNPPGEKA